MTVAELIEQLQKYPSDTEVVYCTGDMGLTTEVTSVEFGRESTIFGYSSKEVVTIF